MSDETFTCPWCGGTEPNAFLLRNNHWVKPPDEGGYDWPKANGMCIAMNLTQNHVTHAGRTVQGGRSAARTDLARAITRAEEVWPPERQAWLAVWRPLLVELDAPERHAAPVESEAVTLW